MFGYVKPLTEELKVKEHTAYQAVYCGLCHAIGGGACGDGQCKGCGGGGSARLALRYDTVFLALTRMLIDRDAVQVKPRRCLLHPVRPRPTLLPCPSLTYSASAGALLFAHSLEDHAIDEGGLSRLLLPYARHLRRTFSARIGRESEGEDDLDGAMVAQLAALRELEQNHEPSADRVADAFGVLLGGVFARDLNENGAECARRIGYHVGRWIYFADALDDLEKDEKQDRYNPFRLIRKQGYFEPGRIRDAMLLDLVAAHRALDAIEGGDVGCRAILHNILALGMVQTTDRLIDQLADGQTAKPGHEPHDSDIRKDSI